MSSSDSLLDTTTWYPATTMPPSLELHSGQLEGCFEPAKMMVAVANRMILEEELRGLVRGKGQPMTASTHFLLVRAQETSPYPLSVPVPATRYQLSATRDPRPAARCPSPVNRCPLHARYRVTGIV